MTKLIKSEADSDGRRRWMFKSWFSGIVAVLFAVLVLSSAPVWAADSGDIIVELSAKKVVKGPDNKEKYESAEKSVPGDIIEYRVVYRNNGKNPVKDLAGTLPVPQGMEYIPSTATPDKVSASLDGKAFGTVPLKRKVRTVNGKEETRDIPYSEYRFLRWDLSSLEAGRESVTVARVRVIATTEHIRAQDVKIIKK
jgi:uncharacterized repeat protein (TIGR01451 family)